MSPVKALRFQVTDGNAPDPAALILGGAGFGPVADQTRQTHTPWPRQALRTERLDTLPEGEEYWLPSEDCSRGGEEAGLHWRRSADLLYGVIELEEAAFSTAAANSPSPSSPLQRATQVAYERIFALLDAQQLPQLWRVWNYMAAINTEQFGLERYRQFNIGRQDAFHAAGRSLHAQLPAACALGFASGPLSIAFLAGRTAILPIENPRQLSAFIYPPNYGPRSPSFSRAALARPPGAEILFISGTASIVGHRSLHADDVLAQTHETIRNIATVLAEANRQAASAPFRLQELDYRVYLRHAEDQLKVADLLDDLLGPARRLHLQADICRSDLLIEIEAQAVHHR